MIEWIPIEEFTPTDYKSYFVCYTDSMGSETVLTTIHFPGDDKYVFGNSKVTHAAKINSPSETVNLPENKVNEELKTAIKEVMIEFTGLVKQGILEATNGT